MITEKSIREAYSHLRKTNNSIPDETLDFMLKASLDKLKNKVDEPKLPLIDWRQNKTKSPSIVIVKDGRTANLDKNYPAIDGDNLRQGFGAAESDPVLQDGEYPFAGFNKLLQYDDSEKVWRMSFDDQYILSIGWPTRLAYYFFKDNLSSTEPTPTQ